MECAVCGGRAECRVCYQLEIGMGSLQTLHWRAWESGQGPRGAKVVLLAARFAKDAEAWELERILIKSLD